MNNKYLKLAVVLLGLVFASFAQATEWSAQDYDLYPGDFNGDGKTDMLYIAKDPLKLSGIALSDGTAPNTTWQTWPSDYLNIGWSGNQYNFVVADFNGDGKADILAQRATAGDHYLLLTDSTNHITAISQAIANAAFGSNLTLSVDQHKLVVGDFNGDGKADLFLQATSASGTHAVVYADANGQFTLAPTQAWTDSSASPGGFKWSTPKANVYAGDFNGDGKSDLLVQAKPTFVMIDYDVTFPVPTYPNAMNGIVYGQGGATPFSSSSYIYWNRISNGVDWSPLTNNLVIADFNGDGRADVLFQPRNASGTAYLLLRDTSGTTFPSSPITLSSNVGISGSGTRLIAANFDGTAGAGLYYQSLTAGGTNYSTNTVGTTTTASAHTYSASASNYVAPKTAAATLAGRTQGSFDVSPSGAATYQIPITVPAGPKGIQPNLKLAYVSQNITNLANGGRIYDGVMGPGWSLSGLSAISRCNGTLAQDGVNGMAEVALSYSDKFCLDGNRLRATSGGYGYDQSVYQTELANFSKITSVGVAGNGPQYFIVKGKDGFTYEYGNSTDSRVIPCAAVSTYCSTTNTTPTTWWLNKVSDRSGNSYTVTYGAGASGSEGVAVPLSIAYTRLNSSSTSYNYEVSFVYVSRTAQNASTTFTGMYAPIAGQGTLNTNLLTTIKVKNSATNTLIRQYALNYGNSPVTGRARLANIQECAGSAGTDCLAPTTMTFQDVSPGVATTALPTGVTASVTVLKTMDFTGDGRDDVLYQVNSSKDLYVLPSGTSGFGTPVLLASAYTNSVSLIAYGDLTRTGRSDILIPVSGIWQRYTWNGSGFSGSPTGMNLVSNAYEAALGDMDGDGLPELLTFVYYANPIRVYRNANTSTATAVSFETTTTVAFSYTYDCTGYTWCYDWVVLKPDLTSGVKMADFNGDGRVDIVYGWAYQSSAGTGQQPLLSTGTTFVYGPKIPIGLQAFKAANLNGDNCTDIVTATEALISDCHNSFARPASGGNLNAVGTFDWNGDGRYDTLGSDGTYFTVRLSSGYGQAASTLSTSIPYTANNAVLDANGDGQPDILLWGSTGISYYLHNTGANSPYPDTVVSFVDGYGMSYGINYSALYGNYGGNQSLLSAGEQIGYALSTVNQVTVSDGIGGTYNRYYAYEGAVYNAWGRGFEGFQSRTVWDSRATTPLVTTYYKTAFPYTGMAYQQDVYQNNGTLISHTVNTPSTLAASTLDGTGNNQRYFPYVASSTTDTYEVGGSKDSLLIAQSTANYAYDGYGNLTSSTSTVTDKDSTAPASPTNGQTWTTTVTNTFPTDPLREEKWCLGLPTQTQVVKSSTVTNETSVTRTTAFTPEPGYAMCRYTQMVTEPNKPNYKVTQSLDYGDGFGNVTGTTVTGNYDPSTGLAMAPRTTTVNWGTTGQFPVIVTNALGQIINEYDYNKGVQIRVTNPNGIPTWWYHDSFGRVIRESHADGTATTWAYENCGTDCVNTNNKLRITQTVLNAGGSTQTSSKTYQDAFDRTLVTKQQLLGIEQRTETQYDPLGRVKQQSVPCDTSNCTLYWNTYNYDALGRVLRVDRPINLASGQAWCDATTTTVATGCQRTKMDYLGRTMVTTDPLLTQSIQVKDLNGWLRKTQDGSGYYQTFGYDAFGSLTSVTDSQSNPLFGATYQYGTGVFQTQTVDKDLGTWNYRPNALGEVTGYTDANLTAFTVEYDSLSRPVRRDVTGETTRRWIWGTSAAAHEIGQLKMVCLDSNVACSGTTSKEAYSYDSIGRLAQTDITADGSTYTYNYGYSGTTGLLDTLTYPTSTSSYRLKLQYQYQNGLLQQVADAAAGTVFWQANTVNAFGNITQETLGNGIVTKRSFDPVTGRLDTLKSGPASTPTSVQNEGYFFDKVGNVIQRQDNKQGLTESFCYDSAYRLSKSALSGDTTCESGNNLRMTYDTIGRTDRRDDIASNAQWAYGDVNHIHAVTQAGNSSYTYTYDNNGNAQTRNGQTILWNKYNFPTAIPNSATESVTLSYDANDQRYKQEYVNGSTTNETTYYIGGLLEKVTNNLTSSIDYRHSIQANGQAVAIMSRLSSGANATRYILDDHEGSIAKITDSSGAITLTESFTAYGNRRNPTTWSGAAPAADLTTSATITRQGYTWQTALGNMGLNHMNGRVQDAITGVFLSADPYISEPTNPQNYNRYSYVYNNPITLTDPSGFKSCNGNTWAYYGYCPGDWDVGTPYAIGYTGGPSMSGFGSGALLDSSICYTASLTAAGSTQTSTACNAIKAGQTSYDFGVTTTYSDGSTSTARVTTSVPQTQKERYPDAIQSIPPIAEIVAVAVALPEITAGTFRWGFRAAATKIAKQKLKEQLNATPDKARAVLKYVREKGSAPPGYVGGRVFKNAEGRLPSGGRYREYDVDPKPSAGEFRNAERVVVDEGSSRAWYTSDHYETFNEIL